MAAPRFDQWLWERRLFDSLEEAQKAVRWGRIRHGRSGEVLDKPGWRVSKNLRVIVGPLKPFVSRAGEKLNHFLVQNQISVQGRICLDVGASTGGFVDCLLQRGASEVYALDVGSHLLHEKLKSDPRVRSREKTDARKFYRSDMPTAPDFVLVDVSFISLKRIVKHLFKQFPNSNYILLFKPQFETSRYLSKKRGVVSLKDRKRSLEEMLRFLPILGLNPILVQDSALRGKKGNQETFIMAESIIPSHIFRTYDIRGNADRDLKDGSMERLGIVLAQRAQKQIGRKRVSIGLGQDDRLSSSRIHSALTRGLSSEGAQVFDLGSITTPMAYFSHFHFDLDGVFQVTASHNPKDDNGLKMMIAKDTLLGDEIISLGREAMEIELKQALPEAKPFKNLHSELETKYLSFLHNQFKFTRKFKILLDTANGMAGAIARRVFEPYAETLEILYEKVDCRFPNHEADPTVPENLRELQAAVKSQKADIGFAFDGDGDRLGVITASGRILWGDEILMLLSEKVLQDQPGATIIGEVKCSEKLFEMVRKKGGKPLMYRTGHSLIKRKMKELKAPLAGEMSGHLFFADRYFGFDDAVYASLRVLEVIDTLKLDLDEWISRYPSYFVTPEIRVACEEEEKEAVVAKVKAAFSKEPDVKLCLIDGVRVTFQDGSWALVRASNTQAVLVVRIEARAEQRLKEIKSQIAEIIGKPLSSVHV